MRYRELPDLTVALLDDATLDALEWDLESFAEIVCIKARQLANAPRLHSALNLTDAFELLRKCETNGVQVSYRHQGADWTDTLIPASGGIQLTRMRYA